MVEWTVWFGIDGGTRAEGKGKGGKYGEWSGSDEEVNVPARMAFSSSFQSNLISWILRMFLKNCRGR